MAITPYITADVVVSSDAKASTPVVGFYTYPQPIPVPSDPLLKGPKEDGDDKDDDDNDNDKKDGDGGGDRDKSLTNMDSSSMAGIVITVQQQFFIPYNRLHALMLFVNIDCPIDLSSASAVYITRALVAGMQLLIQQYVDAALAALPPSPRVYQRFLADLLPHSNLRATDSRSYTDITPPTPTAAAVADSKRGGGSGGDVVAGTVEVDMPVEALSVLVRRVLTDRTIIAIKAYAPSSSSCCCPVCCGCGSQIVVLLLLLWLVID